MTDEAQDEACPRLRHRVLDHGGRDTRDLEQGQLGVGAGEVELTAEVLHPVAREVDQERVTPGAARKEVRDRDLDVLALLV